MGYVRTTDAATEPIPLTEAKTHLRVDHSDDDTYITSMIKAARQLAEEYTQRSFITQTWKYFANEFPCEIKLLHGRAISVTSIKYSVTTALDTTMSATLYTAAFNQDVGKIRAPNNGWPDTNTDFYESIEVIYTAGYGASASNVPEGVKAGIKILLSDMYENRQSWATRQVYTIGLGGRPLYQIMLDNYKIYE